MKSWAVTLLFLCLPVSVGASDSEARFRSVVFDERARVARYEPFTPVDWEGLGRRYSRRFDIDRLTERDIAYLRQRIWEVSTDAEETFDAPLSREERAMRVHLISASGVTPLRAAKFEGTVRFSFDHASPPQIVERKVYGMAVSRRLKRGGGGFALRLDEGESVERIAGTRIVLESEQGRRVLHFADREGRVSLMMPVRWHDAVQVAYGFRVGGQRYLFVAWPADDKGVVGPLCARNFSLYIVGTSLEPVASTSYDCDV